MPSISSTGSSWRQAARRPLLVGLVLLAPLTAGAQPASQGGNVEQAWFRLTQALQPLDVEAVREREDDLLAVAGHLGLERLTPLSQALAADAKTVPGPEAEALLRQAIRLDPGSPEPYLALGDRQTRSGSFVPAAASLARGAAALFRESRLQDVVSATLLLSAVPVILGAILLWGLLAVRRALPRLWHDMVETAAQLRLGVSSIPFAILVLAMPAFITGDPVWLLLWVFALSWAYFPAGQKLMGIAALAFVMASPTLLELGFRNLTHPDNAVIQAARLLSEHRYDPQTVQELAALSDTFGTDPEFHRLEGDCYRQFGLYDAAAWAYREGLRLAPDSGPISLSLGTIEYLQGDYNAALQAFQAAMERGVDPLVGNYDLSMALAQIYHFRESEEAMAAARRADDGRLATLLKGHDQQQLLTPTVTMADAQAMIARKDPVLLLNRGLLPPPLARDRTVLNPLALAAGFALLLALGHFLVREHTTGFAASCLKCGRSFCHRCKLSRESQSYCTQCINIFLKKDMVASDVQLAKRRQVTRHRLVTGVERRVADLLLPGLGLGISGRPIVGVSLALASLIGVAVAFVWLPVYIGPTLLDVSLLPLRASFAALWALALIGAQFLGTGGR